MPLPMRWSRTANMQENPKHADLSTGDQARVGGRHQELVLRTRVPGDTDS